MNRNAVGCGNCLLLACLLVPLFLPSFPPTSLSALPFFFFASSFVPAVAAAAASQGLRIMCHLHQSEGDSPTERPLFCHEVKKSHAFG